MHRHVRLSPRFDLILLPGSPVSRARMILLFLLGFPLQLRNYDFSEASVGRCCLSPTSGACNAMRFKAVGVAGHGMRTRMLAKAKESGSFLLPDRDGFASVCPALFFQKYYVVFGTSEQFENDYLLQDSIIFHSIDKTFVFNCFAKF